MFEKSTRLCVRNLLEKEFNDLRTTHQPDLIKKSSNNKFFPNLKKNKIATKRKYCTVNSRWRSLNERNMTRKTRCRQSRVHSALQFGFCEICHVPYSSLQEHIQTKKHVKLIGDDANFISLNGYSDPDSEVSAYLSLNGIECIDLNGKKSPALNKRNGKMVRTRTLHDKIKESPSLPAENESSGHRLRSRKNVNYMTPPSEDDSLSEKPESVKELRELRSSSRILSKLNNDQLIESDDVWNSGRPKRTCIKQKRISADERLVVDNKSYYKVEVLAAKLRSSGAALKEVAKRGPSPLDDKNDDKLIVKFRKLRSSELLRLNNEAENFLFPKKNDSSDDEDVCNSIGNRGDGEANTRKNDGTVLMSSDNDDTQSQKKFKIDDESSMNSNASEPKVKKRRRTHAEAFIMDNQKYYKFETPGSRLRYQGSYLPSVPSAAKTAKHNGDCAKLEKSEEKKEESARSERKSFDLDALQFSFEKVPMEESWYQTFQRQDNGQERYIPFTDTSYCPNSFIMPYQLGYIPPLDPQECMNHHNQVKKCIQEAIASSSASCSTPDPSTSNSASSSDAPFTQDEDSKISATMTESSSVSTLDEVKSLPKKRGRKPKIATLDFEGVIGKNPRKSPRQHASTLAILSSLIHQRKRRLKSTNNSPKSNLPPIAEEAMENKSPGRARSKIDYCSLAKIIEEELSKPCDVDLLDLDETGGDCVDFCGTTSIMDALNEYDRNVEIGVNRKTKRLFKGTPGRKPGRKKKKNRTGWPNRNKRVLARKDQIVKDVLDDSTADSISATADSETETPDDICEYPNSTDSIKNDVINEKIDQSSDLINEQQCDSNPDRVVNSDLNDSTAEEVEKVLTSNKVNNGSESFNIDLQFQPYVRVQKLNSKHIDCKVASPQKRRSTPKRTNRGQRRMPASPKSPRMLRRPRGRWYRER